VRRPVSPHLFFLNRLKAKELRASGAARVIFFLAIGRVIC
jgi:hypothetical protein